MNNKLTSNSEKLKAVTIEQEDLRDCELSLERTNQALTAGKERKEQLKKLQKDFRELQEEKQNLDKLRSKYLEEKAVADAKRSEYEKLNGLFLDAQAGVLAEKLKEGIPCPVCGSLEHPQKALRPEEVPTEEELKKAKAFAESAQNAAENTSKEAGKSESLHKKIKGDFNENCDKILISWETGKVEELLREDLCRIDEEVRENEEAIKSIENQVIRRDELAEIIKNLQRDIEEISQEIEALKSKVASAGAALDEKKKNLQWARFSLTHFVLYLYE